VTMSTSRAGGLHEDDCQRDPKGVTGVRSLERAGDGRLARPPLLSSALEDQLKAKVSPAAKFHFASGISCCQWLSMPAMAAPRMGASQNSHSWPR